jgi:MarR family transcriptional regulator, organic hydroperoxide resistance regulator
MNRSDELLQLDKQLCFPLYATSRLVTRYYQPLLDKLGLTYPQYLVMLVLWEQQKATVSDISDRLLLNSNTLTPLLKRLEKNGLITRTRSTTDERQVHIRLTTQGEQLKQEAVCIPLELAQGMHISLEEAKTLHQLLHKLMANLQQTAIDESHEEM